MSNALTKFVPARFLPLAGLVAGRPDVARLHLDGAAEAPSGAAIDLELRAEVDELRAEVERLRSELSIALRMIDDRVDSADS